MSHKSRVLFVSTLLIASLFGAGCQPAAPAPVRMACTMEAKQCPDGSYVGRTGPNCEFAACPSPTPAPAPAPTPTPVPPPTPAPTPSSVGRMCSGASDKSCGYGYQCLQDCGPPVVREGDAPPGYRCQTNETASKPRMCPICLASNTLIATPSGDLKVTDLKLGMPVWSVDAHGGKTVQRILKLSQTPVPSTHQVVHLVLSDGRAVWVSPNHPLMSGLPVASLHVGDSYDGAKVTSAELVPYWDSATYDLLPDGETGAYWANGILLKSTLK